MSQHVAQSIQYLAANDCFSIASWVVLRHMLKCRGWANSAIACMQGAVRLDNINLFSIITIMSFFLLAPVTLLLEGVKFTPSAMQAMGIMNSSEIIKKTLLAGLCFHAYQQVHAYTWLLDASHNVMNYRHRVPLHFI